MFFWPVNLSRKKDHILSFINHKAILGGIIVATEKGAVFDP